VSPKLKVATTNLVEVSTTLRNQASHLNETVDTLLNRTNTQIRRVDEMATATFDAVDHAAKAIEHAVIGPARRMSGVFRGLRVGLDVFLGRKKEPVAEEAVVVVETAEAAGTEEKTGAETA
jgi:hypothetical protein